MLYGVVVEMGKVKGKVPAGDHPSGIKKNKQTKLTGGEKRYGVVSKVKRLNTEKVVKKKKKMSETEKIDMKARQRKRVSLLDDSNSSSDENDNSDVPQSKRTKFENRISSLKTVDIHASENSDDTSDSSEDEESKVVSNESGNEGSDSSDSCQEDGVTKQPERKPDGKTSSSNDSDDDGGGGGGGEDKQEKISAEYVSSFHDTVEFLCNESDENEHFFPLSQWFSELENHCSALNLNAELAL